MNHRFFVPEAIEAGANVTLPDEERHHARVLRVREGEEVEVFDSLGKNFVGRFAEDGIAILKETANREPATAIHLAMSIIQLEKFELVLQKATELGVQSFIPLITDRMEVRIERVRGRLGGYSAPIVEPELYTPGRRVWPPPSPAIGDVGPSLRTES